MATVESLFLWGRAITAAVLDRLQGYRKALELRQLVYDEQIVLDSEFNFDGGYTATKLAMNLTEPPTAIFAGHDESALGAIYALQESGIAVPQQVSVCGFDDLDYAKNVWPGLTTVHYPVDAIAEKALATLVTLLEGHQPDQQQVIFPLQFGITRLHG